MCKSFSDVTADNSWDGTCVSLVLFKTFWSVVKRVTRKTGCALGRSVGGPSGSLSGCVR